MTPLRMIFSDTQTGEIDVHDVAVSEFTPAAAIEHLKQKIGWVEGNDPAMFCAAWVVTYGTACFIIQMGDILIHGVCYTNFDPNHDPLK